MMTFFAVIGIISTPIWIFAGVGIGVCWKGIKEMGYDPKKAIKNAFMAGYENPEIMFEYGEDDNQETEEEAD